MDRPLLPSESDTKGSSATLIAGCDSHAEPAFDADNRRKASGIVIETGKWRAAFDGPVYAGVMVVPSVAMARKIGADIKQLAVPDEWLAAIDRDPSAGVKLACDLVEAVRESAAFRGVHLIPVSRYREVAARLEPTLR